MPSVSRSAYPLSEDRWVVLPSLYISMSVTARPEIVMEAPWASYVPSGTYTVSLVVNAPRYLMDYRPTARLKKSLPPGKPSARPP